MTAYTAYYPNTQFNNGKVKLFGLLLLVVILAITIQLSLHAQNHRGEAELVRNCVLKDNNSIEIWQNDFDPNRYYFICQLPDGRFGIYIIQKVNDTYKEVSSFIKNKFKCIEQVHNYLKNSGAFPSSIP